MRISTRHAAVVMAIGLIIAGCNAATPTPQPPAQTSADSAAAAASPVAVATETASPVATDSPAPTPTPTPTTAPTETPAATQTPAAGPGDPAACTGYSAYASYFADVVKTLGFDVYCAQLPSGWSMSATAYLRPHGSRGWFTAAYHNKKKTQTITVGEGDFCGHTSNPSNCWASSSDLGSVYFGNLFGALKDLGGGQFAVFVNPNTKTGYRIVGAGMSQATFISMAAAMVKIPRS
jgi:hypothetical protein